MKMLLVLMIAALLGACSDSTDPGSRQAVGTAVPPTTGSGSEAVLTSENQWMAQWSRNCALCHVRGEGGAPVLGDTEAWAPRLAQGEEVLLQHTIEGLNNMPPLGYCMDCEAADFLEIIRFMGGES